MVDDGFKKERIAIMQHERNHLYIVFRDENKDERRRYNKCDKSRADALILSLFSFFVATNNTLGRNFDLICFFFNLRDRDSAR